MLKHKMKRLLTEENGQGMTEYGLIIGLVAVAVIAVLTTMGGQLKAKFNQIITSLGGTAQ